MTAEEFLNARCAPPGPVPTNLPVTLKNGCRDFLGSHPHGYGFVRHEEKGWRTNRLVYFLVHGQIPGSAPFGRGYGTK